MNNRHRNEIFDEALKIIETLKNDARPGSAHQTKLSYVYTNLKEIAQERTRVAVFMDGGLIQEMYSDRPVEVLKIDLDTEGAEEEELTPYPDRKGSMNKAYISLEVSAEAPASQVDVNEEYVEALWNNQNRKEKNDE